MRVILCCQRLLQLGDLDIDFLTIGRSWHLAEIQLIKANRLAGVARQSVSLGDIIKEYRVVLRSIGKVVLLDFWATWCVPCVGGIPTFNQLQEKYGPQGVKVIGLAVQSGWARDVKRFAAKYKMRYAILVGTDDTVGDFDVIGFPTTYVIAPGWKVFKKYSGAYPEKGNDIERDIQTLLTRNVSAKE